MLLGMRSLLWGLLGLTLLAAAPASAQPELVRDWWATEIDPGAGVRDMRVAPFGIGETIALYMTEGVDERAQIVRGGTALPAQDLPDPGYWNDLDLDGSPLHGAVGAWGGQGNLRVAEIAPGGDGMTVTRTLPQAFANYSYGRPVVQTGFRGEAVVAYVGTLPGESGARVMAVVRDDQKAWSDPLPATSLGPTDSRIPRSAAVGVDGTVALGVAVDGRARVSVRPPGGQFTLSEPLGEPLPEHPWNVPRVGVDAAGAVVAVWLEGAPVNGTGPVMIAFRAPGAERFGPPQDTGLRASSSGQIELGVSAPGEVVLAVEASSDNPYGGTRLEGLHVAYGLTHLQRLALAVRVSDDWRAGNPSFDMNVRGDAILLWDECCPMRLRGRRRLPLGPFGPLFDTADPISFEGVRHGRWVLDADLDDLGNARGGWVDSESSQYFAGVDGPLLDVALPEVGPVGDVIPSVLGVTHAEPEPVPELVDPPVVDVPPLIPTPEVAPQPLPRIAAVDTRAPVLSVAPRRPDRRRVVTTLSCDEACGIRLRARVGRRAGRYVDLLLTDRLRGRLGIPLPRRGRGTIRIEGLVADGAGNLARVSRRIGRR